MKWSTLLAALASLLVLFRVNSSGAQCVDYGQTLFLRGLADTPGYASGIAVSGTTAYVADVYPGALQVFDITVPTAPLLVGAVDIPYEPGHVAVSGSVAYMADGLEGVHFVDVSDPGTPMILGSADTPGMPLRLAAAGALVFVADGPGGLQIIDATNPLSPVIIGSLDLFGQAGAEALDLAVSGSVVYVAGGAGGLFLIDVTQPNAPAILSSVYVSASDVFVVGSIAYVVNDDNLLVIDVSDPESPMMVGDPFPVALDNSPGAMGHCCILVSGTLAYVAGQPGLEVIDVSTPASPVRLGELGNMGYSDIALVGSFLYGASAGVGISITDVTHAESPSAIAKFDGDYDSGLIPGWESARVTSLDLSGSIAYLIVNYLTGVHADRYPSSELKLVDLSNPAVPHNLGDIRVSDDGHAQDVFVIGSHAYVAAGQLGLCIVDVSNSLQPVRMGTVDTPGEALGVVVSGSVAYVADGNSGLQIIDVSNPLAPVILDSVDTPGAAQTVAVFGSLAYIGGSTGLQVIDVSAPGSSEMIGNLDISSQLVPWIWDVTLLGSIAYAAGVDDLLIIDVSNATSPNLVEAIPRPAYDLLISGTTLYVSDDETLTAFEVTNPLQPRILGQAEDVTVIDAFGPMIVGSQPSGLTVLPGHCEFTPVLVTEFTAEPQTNGILLQWSTSDESDVVGFHVLRSDRPSESFTRVTTNRIPSARFYRYLDENVARGVTYYYRLEALTRSGESELFGPVSSTMTAGPGPVLGLSFPNPSRGSATIPFTLSRPGFVVLRVLELTGREVRIILSETRKAGAHTAAWDGRTSRGEPASAGLYLIELRAEGVEKTGSVIRLR